MFVGRKSQIKFNFSNSYTILVKYFEVFEIYTFIVIFRSVLALYYTDAVIPRYNRYSEDGSISPMAPTQVVLRQKGRG